MKAKSILVCVLLSSSLAVAAPAHKKHHHTGTARAHAAHVAKASHPAKLAHARKIGDEGQLRLASAVAMIVDQSDASVIYSRNAGEQAPIASITKLMTAMVVLDAGLDMNEAITVTEDDVDVLRNSSSRLRVGTTLPRHEMLQLALMASENRAAAALARTYPGGTERFVAAMNRNAAQLNMRNTHFIDPTGLHSENVSTAEDLVKMVRASYHYAEIRNMTTTGAFDVVSDDGRMTPYHNTNALVRSPSWDIGLSKTGYIHEAGRCLVMQAKIASRAVIIVLLDSVGRNTRIADANRIKKWLESSRPVPQRLG